MSYAFRRASINALSVELTGSDPMARLARLARPGRLKVIKRPAATSASDYTAKCHRRIANGFSVTIGLTSDDLELCLRTGVTRGRRGESGQMFGVH
ncbi:hypothetical protein EYF80_043201 [Liparis tanakae]|uniref:Uncharacterized protein n=1 Tax=Liparis tanakae TaxID=230148 RepID=A0A4Z2G1A0_9TELE|nr:hypothetical protein EYF80_043201 [Liparis tanakae]